MLANEALLYSITDVLSVVKQLSRKRLLQCLSPAQDN